MGKNSNDPFFHSFLSFLFILSFSMFTWISLILLTPFLLTIIGLLAILAVITSTITSSFIFIRLAFLTIEMVSGLAAESTNWLLSTCVAHLQEFLSRHQKAYSPKNKQAIRPTLKKRKLPPSSLYLNSISYKSTLKSTYSVSVPGTPDPESFNYQLAI